MSECGVSVEEFNKHREEIVRRALADACTQANPRKVTAEDINKILDHIAKQQRLYTESFATLW